MTEKVNTEQLEKQETPTNKGPVFGVRHVQLILAFFLLTIGYGTRVNMSVAVVAMTDSTTSSNPDIPTYDWKNTSVILSSFFWGYVAFQLLAGHLGKKYGPKWFLLGGMFMNSTAGAAIPFMAAKFGSTGVICCRVLQGLSQGFFFPSTHTILGQWAPAEERSFMASVAYSGVPVGSLIATLVTGLIAASPVGWPVSFYFGSALGYCWCVFWFIFGYNSPAAHPKISPQEKKYIQMSLDQHEHHEELPVPWKSILTSKAHWAVVAANMGQAWGTTTLMTEVPTYLSKVMGLNMKSNGIVTASPAVLGIIFGLVCGNLADFLMARGRISRLNIRRLFQFIGGYVPALALITLSLVSSDHQAVVIVLLNIAQSATAATLAGSGVNQIDLSPKFSGILMGFSNGLSQVFSLCAPLMVQFVVTDTSDVTLWRIVFMTSACFYILSSGLFLVFATAERKWWDSRTTKEETSSKKHSVIEKS